MTADKIIKTLQSENEKLKKKTEELYEKLEKANEDVEILVNKGEPCDVCIRGQYCYKKYSCDERDYYYFIWRGRR